MQFKDATVIGKLTTYRVFHKTMQGHIHFGRQEKLLAFGWKALPYPGDSVDIVPSNYLLFHSLQNFSKGKNFNIIDQIALVQ